MLFTVYPGQLCNFIRYAMINHLSYMVELVIFIFQIQYVRLPLNIISNYLKPTNFTIVSETSYVLICVSSFKKLLIPVIIALVKHFMYVTIILSNWIYIANWYSYVIVISFFLLILTGATLIILPDILLTLG